MNTLNQMTSGPSGPSDLEAIDTQNDTAGQEPLWPAQAKDLADVIIRLIRALDNETDLIHAHRNDEVAASAEAKNALGAEFGRALAAMVGVEIDPGIRSELLELDRHFQDALTANANALGGGLESFERILSRAAKTALPRRQMPVGYGPNGAPARNLESAGPSLLSGLKL